MNVNHLYFGGGETSTEPPEGEVQAAGEPKLVWKVLLRTGTWKLRPGPGGQKVDKPLSVYRDKAPKGHISLSEIKRSFDEGAIEYVTAPVVHADGTMDNKGFIRKLAIQDVKGEDGSRETQSLLWAGFEITEPDAAGMIQRRTIPSVSAGVVFDYERPEDGRKFSQVLVHAMLTHKPWINGTGGFTDKLPDGVFASGSPAREALFGPVSIPENERLVFMGFSIDLENGVKPDPDPTAPGSNSRAERGSVVWKPEQGFQFMRGRVQKALDLWRTTVLRQRFPSDQYDIPYYSVDDVTLDSDNAGTALICSGYGSEREAWVAGFKSTDDGVEIDPYMNWTPAKQEWVAASEQPFERRTASGATGLKVIPSIPEESDPLRAAQRRRAEALGLSNHNTNGGAMAGINLAGLLDGVELSPEQRQSIELAQQDIDKRDRDEAERKRRDRESVVDEYVGTADKKGTLDEVGLGDPGIKAYVRNVLLSDDSEPALAFSEFSENGARTEPVNKTASDVIKGFIDALPKKDGKVSLSEQARRLPDDTKPDETGRTRTDANSDDPAASADALVAELSGQGHDLGPIHVPSPDEKRK